MLDDVHVNNPKGTKGIDFRRGNYLKQPQLLQLELQQQQQQQEKHQQQQHFWILDGIQAIRFDVANQQRNKDRFNP